LLTLFGVALAAGCSTTPNQVAGTQTDTECVETVYRVGSLIPKKDKCAEVSAAAREAAQQQLRDLQDAQLRTGSMLPSSSTAPGR
jgi:hypothetical protein